MRAYRWGLVAAALLGVLAMHGVGSHGVHGAEGNMAPTAHSSAGLDHMAVSVTHEAASPSPIHERGLGLEVLCVATLVGFVLALRLLLRVRSAADRWRRVRHAYAMVRPRARGPDPPTLARLSILRC